MCNAYYNDNNSWRINPMFIAPKGALAAGYTCAASCADEGGTTGACRDLGGNLIPTQTDGVH